jgi:WD40 repeat protein
LAGEWDSVAELLPDLSIGEAEERMVKFYIKEQKYLELIENNSHLEALDCLRAEVVPLNAQEATRMHLLASHLLSTSADELKENAGWSGSSPEAREELLARIQEYVPPQLMLPPCRLDALISQALTYQINSCKYHHSFQGSYSLLQDHVCREYALPTTCVQTIDELQDEVWDLAYSPDCSLLAVIKRDASIVLFIKQDGLFVKDKVLAAAHSRAINCIAWSPDGRRLMSCGADRVVKIWDVETAECLKTIREHTDAVTTCLWLPSGEYITGGIDFNLALWSTEGVRVQSWRIRVRQAERSHKGNIIAVLNACKPEVLILCLDLESRREVKTITEHEVTSSIALSRKGTQLLTNTSFTSPVRPRQTIHLWDIQENECIMRYKGHEQERFALKCSFGGKLEEFVISGGESGRIYLWNKLHGTLLSTLEGHQGPVNAIAWKEPHVFASASDDQSVRIWRLTE